MECWLSGEILIGSHRSGEGDEHARIGATEMSILISSHLHAHF